VSRKGRMRKVTPLHPSDSGFNDPRFPWGGIRNLLGMKKPDNINLEIHGFFLVDKRQTPPLAIFKNCRFPMQVGVRPVLHEPLQPFQYLNDAMAVKASMNLSMEDDRKVRITAMVPDPGMGEIKPDTMWVDKKEAKNR